MDVLMTNGLTPYGSLARRWNVLWNELDPAAARKSAPAADVVEDADGYHFYFEMAGIRSDSVDVRVEDGNLVVEAERKRPEWSKDAEIHVAERSYGTMRRAFTMPEDASHENIKGAYKDGVLEVTVPKRPESKPFKIKVEFDN
ncbi:MAG TPA: Hsp20/alpha crystallin family protein [Candidatus Acidoferrales bacterium]|nr:Hsp20/alpha crystallin family protein [Candidatus Acidoferrales bacterium]